MEESIVFIVSNEDCEIDMSMVGVKRLKALNVIFRKNV